MAGPECPNSSLTPILAVSVQYTLDVVAAVWVAGELVRLTQVGDAVDGKTSAFQFRRRTTRAGGAHQLAQFKATLQNSIQTLLAFTDYISNNA